MSILIMSQVWAEKLEPIEKLVALCVADFADDDGKAWPGLATVAVKSGLSESTVRRKLKSLEDQGKITITPRKDKSGRDTSALVQFAFCKGEGVSLLPLQPARVAACQSSTVTGGGCHRDTLFHETSINHQKTPAQFAQFWEAYPKRKDKQKALKAFQKLNPNLELFQQILAALDWQKQQPEWLKSNGQFVPLPASWLNGRRWEDERPATSALPTTGTADSGASADYLRKAGLIT